MALRQFVWAFIICIVARTSAGRLTGSFSALQNQFLRPHKQPFEHDLSVTASDANVAPGMEASVSAYGLNYAKDVVVHEILDEMTPMAISDIFLTATTYYFGSVQVDLTEIVLANFTILSADIALDEDVITVFAQEVEANMTLKWHYAYAGLVGDNGIANVQVHGMQVGISFNLSASHGALKMFVKERGVVIEGLDIELSGGRGSWLYNWLITNFASRLKAAAESAIDDGMLTAANKIDDYLQALPRTIAVDSVSAIDATILSDPEVRRDSLSFKPRCEFVSAEVPLTSGLTPPPLPHQLVCGGSEKMVTIAITDMVAHSAALVYYKAGRLAYVVDQLPPSVPLKLNTSSWRFILPQLYKTYPSQDMLLSLAVAAPPQLSFSPTGVATQVEAEMVIQVLDPQSGEATSVACLAMGLVMGGQAGVRGNNLTGEFWMDDLTVGLKWSEIGSFPVSIMQTIMKTTVRNVIIPLLNLRLQNGFPIPVIPGVVLTEAEITYADQYLLVCTNVEYTGGIFGRVGLDGLRASIPTAIHERNEIARL